MPWRQWETGLVVSSTKQGRLLIKWGGPGLPCHVPSADTFTPTNFQWVTLWWQILDTSWSHEAIQPTFNSYSLFMICNHETVKVTLKAEFQYSSSSQWITGAWIKCVLGTVPWCLCSKAAFGITELFKQAAQVTNCTQESREQDLAQTTPPGSMCCVCLCICVQGRERECVFLIEKDRDVCARVCVMRIQEQLNFSTCQKCFPSVYRTTQLSMVF